MRSNLTRSLPLLDYTSKMRIVDIIKYANSSVRMQDILEKHNKSVDSQKFSVDKTITMGKVEGAIETTRTTFQKLEEGYNIEDAQVICSPEEKLELYLAPFIYGSRYTSFGRHFTKGEKL